ncbi:MAG: colanic acid biosynthesis glycosyltransferase WcaL, partial [Chloroflexaceae bacterium]|nr:colanic acid biosynthesis glycosyltransferase WcaL [Chloroflexaceae bacterium]
FIYHQVKYAPIDIENHIVCQYLRNLDQFAVPNIHALEQASPWQQTWDRWVRKSKVRPYLGYLVEQAQRCGARVLHSHFGPGGWNNLGAARRARLKHVVTFYGLDINYLPTVQPRWRERYRDMFRQIDRVLCEGSYMAGSIAQLGCPAEKILVHHLGIAVDAIAFQPRCWQPGEPLRVLLTGTFHEKKGIPYALEALGRLQHSVPLEITVIGDAKNEPRSLAEKQKILATIAKHDLHAKVRLLGYQPYARLFEEAYQHHIFLAPSVLASNGDCEGGAPVTIIEMAATGMPVVSTRHCDIPGVVLDGVTGLLADERDVDGLIARLCHLISNPQQWQAMAEAARRHIEAEFDARVQGERLAAIYRDLAQRTA